MHIYHSAFILSDGKIEVVDNNKIDLEKLVGRICKASDALEHFMAIQESYAEIDRFIPWVHEMNTWSLQEHADYLRFMSYSSSTIKNFLFFYEDKLVGAGHLHPSSWLNTAEISYWVRTGYQGHGIGEAIATKMANHAYGNLGFRHSLFLIDRNNVGSKKIVENLGATLQLIYGYITHHGEHSNMVVYTLTSPLAQLAARYDDNYLFDPLSCMFTGFYFQAEWDTIQRLSMPNQEDN